MSALKLRDGASRTAVLHFALPVLLLVVALALPHLRVLITLSQPDLASCLVIVVLVLVFKGLYELALLRRAFRHT